MKQCAIEQQLLHESPPNQAQRSFCVHAHIYGLCLDPELLTDILVWQ